MEEIMEEEEKVIRCEICKSGEAKYRCPACGVRFCCVPCSKKHKKDSSCTGARDRSRFVEKGEFDDNVMREDFLFLSEVKTRVENCSRLSTSSHWKRARIFKSFARKRDIKLDILPAGMAKRKQNMSFYNINENTLFWTLNFEFRMCEFSHFIHNVNENSKISEILSHFLDEKSGNFSIRSNLMSYVKEERSKLTALLVREPTGVQRTFVPVDVTQTLRETLQNQRVIEYPSFVVLLPGFDNSEFPLREQ